MVPQLVSHYLGQGVGPVAAAAAALKRLEGAFALAILFAGHDDLLIGARRGSPLAVGYGDGEMYVGSDALALAPLTNRIQYLEEGDWAVLNPRGATVYDADGQPVAREIKQTALSGALIGKGNYRHFMHKEIHEQPAVIGDTLRTFASPLDHRISLPELPVDFATLPRLAMVACGTAYYACMVAKYWFEQLAGLPVDLDIGSEFRYRDTPLVPGSAALFVSQSGETADTLGRHAPRQGPRARDHRSGQRAREHARARGRRASCARSPAPRSAWPRPRRSPPSWRRSPAWRSARRGRAAGSAPSASASSPRRSTRCRRAPPRCCCRTTRYERIAHDLVPARDVLYIGRGTGFAVALEGALKLKEISYIHAEGYAAGELKHGPIALIDEDVPVIVVAPPDHLFDKTASNLQEVVARGGKVILLERPARLRAARRLCSHRGRPARGRPVRGADPVRDPGPVARLPHRGAQRHRRRPAAQPREVGHRRIAGTRARKQAVEAGRRPHSPRRIADQMHLTARAATVRAPALIWPRA